MESGSASFVACNYPIYTSPSLNMAYEKKKAELLKLPLSAETSLPPMA